MAIPMGFNGADAVVDGRMTSEKSVLSPGSSDVYVYGLHSTSGSVKREEGGDLVRVCPTEMPQIRDAKHFRQETLCGGRER